MKIELTNHNPLRLVLEYLETVQSGVITQSVLEYVKGYLKLGGVTCESDGEVMACLALMHNLHMIDLIETENYYEVKVIYGK